MSAQTNAPKGGVSDGREPDGSSPAGQPAASGGLARTVALVGLMGVGKSTVGKKLAAELGAPFLDSDEEIEKAAGLSVQEIFDKLGEPEFRRGERRVIERLVNGPPIVLATGGGAYMDAETRALLKDKATTVWLRADIEVIWKRVNRRDTRPLLKRDNPRQVLIDLSAARSPIYAEADIVVESGEGPAADTVKAILEALGKA
ncbi:MAG TPA: shikimate kinase [Hyphomonadaceae bacterium]|nr:shikimate kinase [Hyphomonadaceae bacterium]